MSDLDAFRARLDVLDDEIVRLLGARFEVCRQVAAYKSTNDVPMMQPNRVEQVRARYLERGEAASLPADFAGALFELIIDATCRMEDVLMAQAAEAGASATSPASGTLSGGAA